MGTKNELQRWLKQELRNRGIDIDTYDFEGERELQAPATPGGASRYNRKNASIDGGTRSFKSLKPETAG